MTIEQILDTDAAVIDGLETETAIIESINRELKALRICAKKHATIMYSAKHNADTAVKQEDHDLYDRWMKVFWQEERCVRELHKILNQHGVPDELIEDKEKQS